MGDSSQHAVREAGRGRKLTKLGVSRIVLYACGNIEPTGIFGGGNGAQLVSLA